MTDYDRYATLIAGGRSKRDRPLQNNTRAVLRGEDVIAIELHATDVVQLRRDGSRTLSSGGWRTMTTLDRIRSYGSHHIVNQRGEWLVACEDDPRDPRPRCPDRLIPKPFHAANPGPEPEKAQEGCLAGKIEPYAHVNEALSFDYAAESPTAWVSRSANDGRCCYVETWHNATLEYTAKAPNYWERQQSGNELVQCPHCAAFDKVWRRWNFAMNASVKCYTVMLDNLEGFGSHEAWQEAYLAEFREVREARQEFKRWARRNFVPFYDGIEVLSSGLVPLASKRIHEKRVRREERDEVKAARAARIDAARERKLAKQLAEEREIRTEIARILAESIAAETEGMLPEAMAWRSGQFSHLEAA